MLAMEICVLSVAGIVSVSCLFFRGGNGSRIFLLAAAIWPVVEFSEMYLGCYRAHNLCERMLTPGVYLRDVSLHACEGMSIRLCFTRQTKCSISSCGPQNHALLSIIGISADIILS
jgi:hypothetical protein